MKFAVLHLKWQRSSYNEAGPFPSKLHVCCHLDHYCTFRHTGLLSFLFFSPTAYTTAIQPFGMEAESGDGQGCHFYFSFNLFCSILS